MIGKKELEIFKMNFLLVAEILDLQNSATYFLFHITHISQCIKKDFKISREVVFSDTPTPSPAYATCYIDYADNDK